MSIHTKTRRALFFDIDGVLHPTGIAFEDDAGGSIYCDPPEQRFMWATILEELLEPHPDVLLVCHSSWRHRFDLDALRAILPPRLAARLVGMTELYVGREQSILDYVEHHGIAPDAYMILDDEKNAFAAGAPQLVHVNSSSGVSAPKARAAIAAALDRLCAPTETTDEWLKTAVQNLNRLPRSSPSVCGYDQPGLVTDSIEVPVPPEERIQGGVPYLEKPKE